MYPLTKHWPKPLLLVKEKPIISHTIAVINSLKGISEVVVITNDKFYPDFQEWAKDVSCNYPITVINDGTASEKDRLGAIGDVHFVLKNRKINEDVLVIGGDNLFTFDIRPFISFAQKQHRLVSVGLYDIRDPLLSRRYGIASLDADGKIEKFLEKPEYSDSTLISTCIYYFAQASLPFFDEYVFGKDCHDTTGDYINWLVTKTDVWGYEFSGEWYDIGDIITFYHASVTFKD